MVDGRPACRPCKLKKKRCPHRFVVESEAELDCEPTTEPLPEAPTKHVRGAINGKNETPATSNSSDELSSNTSDVEEEKPTLHRRPKRGRPFAPIMPNPLPEIPDLPSDTLEAASALSVHQVFARELADRLQEYDMNFRASQQAHRATMTSAKAVKRAVDAWIEAWSSGR